MANTVSRKEREQARRSLEARRNTFKVLREMYPEAWEKFYSRKRDRDEARKLMRANYLNDYNRIYAQIAHDLGINIRHPELLEKQEELTIQTQALPNGIVIAKAPSTAQVEFVKLGYTLIAKDPMPSPSGGVFSSMSKLLFADDQDGTSLEVVGCNKCLMLFKNLQATSHHIGRVHNGKTGRRKKRAYKKRTYASTPITRSEEIVPQVTTAPILPMGTDPVKAITDLVAQRQYWEAQAKAYEEQLNAIRQAFNGTNRRK
jgi:uncharacterized C2H2 Zn-finger protein